MKLNDDGGVVVDTDLAVVALGGGNSFTPLSSKSDSSCTSRAIFSSNGAAVEVVVLGVEVLIVVLGVEVLVVVLGVEVLIVVLGVVVDVEVVVVCLALVDVELLVVVGLVVIEVVEADLEGVVVGNVDRQARLVTISFVTGST